MNFLAHQAGDRKKVFINLDETNIKLMPKMRCGFLVTKARKMKRSSRGLAACATKAQLRGSFTHVGIVCDSVALQKHLPQWLIVSKSLFTKADIEMVRLHLPGNMKVIHKKSAWMDGETFTLLLKEIKEKVQQLEPDTQIILSADCFKAHLTHAIWRTCVNQSIFYGVIPSKLTWALQPCDTHVFALLKRKLQEHCMQKLLATPDGVLTKEALMGSLVSAISEVVCDRDWSIAFSHTGLVGHQRDVTGRLLGKLALESLEHVGHEVPTLQQLMTVLPKGFTIPLDLVFGCFLPRRVHGDGHHAVSRHRAVTRSMSAASASSSCAAAAIAPAPPCPPPPAAAMPPPPLPPPASPPPPRLLRLPSTARLPRSSSDLELTGKKACRRSSPE